MHDECSRFSFKFDEFLAPFCYHVSPDAGYFVLVDVAVDLVGEQHWRLF